MRRKMPLPIFKYLFSFQRYSSFKICKLAKWWHHILNQTLIKYDEKRYLSQFVSEMFILRNAILVKVLHNVSLKVLLPWQHTGFQTSPILKTYFLVTFSVSFSYLQMVPRGFIKGCAPGKLTGCKRDLATNLPGCFCLLFLLSFIRKT